MTKIKGICKNIDNCTLAEERVVQLVEKKKFVCDECHKPLTVVEDKNKNNGGLNKKLIAIIAAVIVLIIGIVVAISSSGDEKKLSKQEFKKSVATKENTVKQKIDVSKDSNKKIAQAVNSAKEIQNKNSIQETTYPYQGSVATRQKTKVITVTKVVNEKSAQDANSEKSSLHLSYGLYNGEIKYGYPNGMGRLTYSRSRQINRYDNKSRKASAGDYLIGEFVNGFFVQGKHFNSNGDLIETLMIGVPAGNAYESK